MSCHFLLTVTNTNNAQQVLTGVAKLLYNYGSSPECQGAGGACCTLEGNTLNSYNSEYGSHSLLYLTAVAVNGKWMIINRHGSDVGDS